MLDAEMVLPLAEPLVGPYYDQATPDFVPAPVASRDFRPLDRSEVQNIIRIETEDALGGLGSRVSDERRRAIRMYYGRELGNEMEGRSKVIMTEVADTVEWILPSLMRMFFGGPYVVKYTPTRAGQEAGCKQATAYINHVFKNQCRGYHLMHDWFKTALIEKNGFVKPYYEERFEPQVFTYRGLTEEGLMMLLADGDLFPIAFEQRPPSNGMGPTFDVTVQQMRAEGCIKVDGIPPEEFLIARRAIMLDDYTPFAAHRKKVSVSDLIAMGFDPRQVKDLPSDDSLEYTQERTERLSEDETFPVTRAARVDTASRDLWVTEGYLRIDEDGDGYTELRKITYAGEGSIEILGDEQVNWNPLCSLTPVPMPHKFFGISIADQVADLQMIKSTLMRQMLDNLYLQNNGRWEVVEGAVVIDDLLESRPGGIVRVDAPGMVNPLATQPFNQLSYQMLEYLDQVREGRTGVSRNAPGPDASTLQRVTDGGVNQMANIAHARIEMIARHFAEGGVKDLFTKLLRLHVESPIKPQVLKMRGEWIEIDPSTWEADYNVEVQVGCGVGQAAERIAFMAQLMNVQREMVAGGLSHVVTPDNIFNSAEKMAESMGFATPELFFTDPQGQPPPPAAPDPDIVESERRERDNAKQLELDAKKLEADLAKEAAQNELKKQELEDRKELERERIASQERIALRKCEVDAEIARMKGSESKEEES